MITIEGLEEKLRKLKVWTKFQKNLKDFGIYSINILIQRSTSYRELINLSFTSNYTLEGFDFWNNIANKIDKVKL